MTLENNLNIYHDLYDSDQYAKLKKKNKMLREIEAEGKSDLEIFPELMEDLFYSLYKPCPTLKENINVNPTYQLNRFILKSCILSMEWKQLRIHTRRDHDQSGTALIQLSEQIIAENKDELIQINSYLIQIKKTQVEKQKLNAEMLKLKNLNKTPMSQDQQNEIKRQYEFYQNKVNEQNNILTQNQTQASNLYSQLAQIGNLTSSISSCLATVEMQDEFFGWGSGMGDFSPTDFNNRLELSQMVRNNPHLLEIARLAGRLRLLSAKKKKQKTKHSYEEISAIVQSNNVSRIIPSEFLYLLEPDLEAIFNKKLAENELLCYELSGYETKLKGPMIICIDVSGSMAGNEDIWSKAIALALIQIAHKEKRSAIVIPFDDGIGTIFEFFKGKVSFQRMLEMASYFTGGCTKFTQPLEHAMKYIEEEKKLQKADIIFITDGDGALSKKTKEKFIDLKQKLNFSMITIVIGEEYGIIDHTLKPISDHLYPIEELNEEIAADLFEQVQ